MLRSRDWGVGLLGIAALAVWARLTALPQVFVEGLVMPAFPDVHYHIRRIWQTLEQFPHVPVFDPQLNWPEGGPCPWPPGFDVLGAAFVKLLGGAGDAERAAHTVAFFPVVLGLFVVFATVWIAKQLVPRSRAGAAEVLAAGGLAAVLPQAVVISQVGSVDHHVAEALAMAMLGGWVLWAARTKERPRVSWVRFEIVGAGIAAFAGSVFNGSILYAAIAGGLLMALRLASPGTKWAVDAPTERAVGSGPSLLWGSGFTAMALAACWLLFVNHGLVATHGKPWDFRFPTYLQPLLHAVVALGCLGAAFCARLFSARASLLERVALRTGALAGLVLAACLVGMLIVPAAAQQLMGGFTQWLLRSDPWLAGINEFQPLFPSWALWRPETFASLWQVHGLFGLLAPVLLPIGVWRAWQQDRVVGACFAGWTLALVALTLLQSRFGRVLTPNLAIAGALTVGWALRSLATYLSSVEAVGSRTGLRGPLAALSVVALLMASDPAIRKELAWREAREPSALEAASLYLRSLPGPREGGVLTKWDYGHTVLAVGKRPVVAAGFGPWAGEVGFHEVGAALHRQEAELMELMERRKLDYVVAGLYSFLPSAHAAGPDDPPAFLFDAASGRVQTNPAFFGAKPLSSLIFGGGGMPASGVRHAAHLLPRFVSAQRVEGPSIPVFQFWVYERVAGVALRGHAKPFARVSAQTQLRLNGEIVPYVAWTDAGADGSYELVVALPSDWRGESVETAPFYQVVAGEEVVAQVALPEHLIRAGGAIDL